MDLTAPNIEATYPLSPLQQGMLFHSLRDPDAAFYCQQSVTATEGLDVSAFRRAWQRLLDRHTILRTSFHWEGLDSPLQAVHREVALPVEEHDWRALPPADQKARLTAFLLKDRKRGFVLSEPPMLRLALIHIDEDTWYYVWSHHHILLDGWSAPLVFKEVWAHYQALRRGREPSLPPARPYQDYIAWLGQQELGGAESFWRQNLAGFTEPTPLPLDRLTGHRPHLEDCREQVREELSEALSTALQTLARRHGLTLNTVVQGAWALLLARHSGRDDVVFGATVSGRPPTLPGVESIVGMFINTLPVRVRVPFEQPILPWLTEIQKRSADLTQYEHSPLTQVNSWSEVPRGTPLFQSLVVFDNYPVAQPSNQREGALRVRSVHQAAEHTNYPLMLVVLPRDEVVLNLVHNPAQYDRDTALRVLDQLKTLLANIAANPEQLLGDVPLMGGAERDQVVRGWNSTATVYPTPPSLHGLIEAQVEKTPDAIALVYEEEQLTYRELNARANKLAHHLRALGVGPDVPVALCLERSVEMVVGLLGILKAGGAYVPLDPSYPQERLAYMLEDAQAPVLLTQERLLARLGTTSARVLCLDSDWSCVSNESDENPQSGVTLDNLAYIIYTSGSTGQPKGAMNTHRGICNRLQWMQEAYPLTEADRVLQKTPFSFDVSVWEFFWPLLTGARLVVARPGGHQDGAYLASLIAEQGITTLHFVPSMLSVFLEEKDLSGCDCIKRVICSGEALPYELQEKFFSRVGAELHNLYGPTEAAVDVTFWPCQRNSERKIVPIGKPIANIQMYVLDSRLQPLPVGVAGELHIGGVGLARGYWNKPELTAAKFIRDPFSGEPGAKLYKTGDLARWLPDGNIEYLGRIDFQVKIRGNRIELGEIESVLSKHPAIRESVVVVRDDLAGGKGLVAYVVGKEQTAPGAGELRTFLKERLPEYMVPTAFVSLAALPLSPNGKLDRKALPAPELRTAEVERAYVAPSTPAEEALAAVWATVLKLDRIGVNDNFFELGGDSILSIQVVSRASRAGLKLTPRQLFQHPTIAALAAAASEGRSDLAEQGPVTGTAPLTPIQAWFLGQGQPEPHHFNYSTVLEVRRPVPADVLERALASVVAHHDALRTRLERTEDGWRQRFASVEEAPVPLERFDLSAVLEEEQGAALEKEARKLQVGLNLSGPLMRAAYFDRGTGRTARLLVVAHHLVVDTVSWRLMLEDFVSACQQTQSGGPVRLPLKTTGYRRWAEGLEALARSGGLDSELAYWLDPARSDVQPLPRDHPDGVNSKEFVSSVIVRMSEDETQALLQEVPRIYKTEMNDALLSALTRAFARWTGQEKLLVDLEGHGREELIPGADLSRTVGWFTSLFPVLLDVGGTNSPAETIKAVRAQLQALPKRGAGYGPLRYLHGDAEVRGRLQAMPHAKVMFNYLGRMEGGGRESGLFAGVQEPAGPTQSARGPREHLMEITASVRNGRLHVRWVFSTSTHKRKTIEVLSRGFIEALQELVAQSRAPEAGGFKASDFPLADLSQTDLEKLIPQLLNAEGNGTAGTRQDVEDIYDLSPLQQGLLFHTLRDPEAGLYCQQAANPIRDLDVAAFRQAWQEVIDRHPILRTSFHWDGLSKPVQVVHRQAALSIEERDWRDLPPADQEARLQVFLQEDRKRGFVFGEAPLLRLTLIRIADDMHYSVWSRHHILIDGWSNPLLLREVSILYQALRGGRKPKLPPARPYRDYIAWLHEQELPRAEAFWRQNLKGVTEPTPLPLDRLDGQRPDREILCAEEHVCFPESLLSGLQALGRRHGLTLNTVVQGAWALLLARHSGRDDVVFGGTVSGRPPTLPGVESIVGLFINTLPVRIRVPAEQSLIPWLQDIQARQADLTQFEYSPLVKVHGWSEVPRGTPLFQSIFVFENYPTEKGGAHQKETAPGGRQTHRPVQQMNHPLTVVVVPQGSELLVKVVYATGRYDSATVSRLLAQFGTLLEGISSHAEQRLGDVPLLSDSERQQVLVAWNDTAQDYPRDKCVGQLFEEQVSRTPDAPAVMFQGRTWSYAELNRLSNQLARRLRKLGAERGSLVGLCLERSPEAVVAILAVHKAGAAYVPLDPGYPPDRLAFMIQDAGVRLLLTEQHLREVLPAGAERILCLDAEREEIAREEDGNLDGGPTPTDLAYVIYTSGSTGKPKGVLIEHRSLTNLIVYQVNAYEVLPGSRIFQFASLNFDASVGELMRALTSGACLCMAWGDALMPGPAMLHFLHEQRVTHITLPPSVLTALPNAELPLLKTTIVGGEACSADLVARWGANRRFFNAYGPTEATVCATVSLCSLDGRKPTIGRPIANTRVYLLDANLQPVPQGVAGELHIGGDGLARGYLNQPELTAAKFIRDPFSSEPGARLYKTGDLCRWLPTGELEFLGRIDEQVKIRGFRIELGEIESVLSKHPDVRENAVIAREDNGTPKRLVAYVVGKEQPGPGAADLRTFLKDRLPEYMVPAAFVPMTALPLTPNGKVARKALPAPALRTAEQERAYVAPSTPAEEALAAVWAAVLKLDRVGVNDNFFELGGDSILSIQVVSRAARAGLKLTPRQLFQHPTIAALATAASEGRAELTEQGPVTGTAPLTPIQEWFLSQGQPEPHHFNQATLLEVRRPVPADVLDRAVAAVVAHHDALRTRLERTEDGWRQRFASIEESQVPLERFDLSGLPEGEQGPALEKEARTLQEGLNMESGPVLRAAQFERGTGRTVRLLLVAHHLVVDAVSWRPILEDLASACQQIQSGGPVRLPLKTTGYRRWAEGLEALARSGGLDNELTYWVDPARADIQPLPIDHPEGANTRETTSNVRVTLNQEDTQALLQEVPKAYGTEVNDALLSALARAFARWTGQERLLVDLEGHGREELLPGVDLSRTVGWFTSLFPVLLDVGGTNSPAEALKAVRSQLQALPKRGAGYGVLRYLHGDAEVRARFRDLPQSEVSFNYLGRVDRMAGEAGLLARVDEPMGPMVSRRGVRNRLLTINGWMSEGQLEFRWAFSTNLYEQKTVGQLARSFIQALRDLVAECRGPQEERITPSDFPAARLNQADFDKLVAQIA
jgi:amino acid adenylation domain-containing protein/non-ribosomal peptide synthase protein (TIGR01720 family)